MHWLISHGMSRITQLKTEQLCMLNFVLTFINNNDHLAKIISVFPSPIIFYSKQNNTKKREIIVKSVIYILQLNSSIQLK